jgi:hypothetical protein
VGACTGFYDKNKKTKNLSNKHIRVCFDSVCGGLTHKAFSNPSLLRWGSKSTKLLRIAYDCMRRKWSVAVSLEKGNCRLPLSCNNCWNKIVIKKSALLLPFPLSVIGMYCLFDCFFISTYCLLLYFIILLLSFIVLLAFYYLCIVVVYLLLSANGL